ncbi:MULTISPECIES: BON domain-containing protein [Paraburkholderia]|uniref:BON domain-containing protein n=1 Tax=Paraburkholderia unamae TaxID=219649 RepID=A0ACC6RHL5_9BURK
MKRILILKTAAGAACMTFALLAGAQTTTNSAAPAASSESVGQHVDDATITTKVKAELLGAKNVKSEHIHVKTRKGVVSLTGTVPSAEDRDNARQVVEGVSGVTSVKNHLKVSAAS